jgi:hypothetical protein
MKGTRSTAQRRVGRLLAIHCSLVIGVLASLGALVGTAQGDPSAGTEVVIVARAAKIAQLIGDYDRQRDEPTINRTEARFGLLGTDLGIPFLHGGHTYVLFGDTVGAGRRDGDSIAVTDDVTPEDGLDLEFLTDASGIYRSIEIPGVRLGPFEVPVEGVSVGGKMYVYCTTDHDFEVIGTTVAPLMNRSIVAISEDDGESFTYLYDVSTEHFINVSIVEVDSAEWDGFPLESGPGLVVFGSGRYRASNVRLAFQPADRIEAKESLRYFVGLDEAGRPTWSSEEEDAQALFDQPCVGEFSVSYNRFIEKWVMLYNCCCDVATRGIDLRTAERPWGPWSEPEVLFEPWQDGGYCGFMHTNWNHNRCDEVHDPGREYEWGGEYGPYQFEHLAIGDDTTTTIYFTMSTWNPYTVVLMKATLALADGS